MRVEEAIPHSPYLERRDFEHSKNGKGGSNISADVNTAQRGSEVLPDNDMTGDEDDDEDDTRRVQ